jgi:hypothetical protein
MDRVVVGFSHVVQADAAGDGDHRHGRYRDGVLVVAEPVQQQRGQFHIGQAGQHDQREQDTTAGDAGPVPVSVAVR